MDGEVWFLDAAANGEGTQRNSVFANFTSLGTSPSFFNVMGLTEVYPAARSLRLLLQLKLINGLDCGAS